MLLIYVHAWGCYGACIRLLCTDDHIIVLIPHTFMSRVTAISRSPLRVIGYSNYII